MISKFLSIFSLLDRFFGWLHDMKIRRQIELEQQLDLQKGKIVKMRVEEQAARMTDEEIRQRLEKTGGYRADSDL